MLLLTLSKISRVILSNNHRKRNKKDINDIKIIIGLRINIINHVKNVSRIVNTLLWFERTV